MIIGIGLAAILLVGVLSAGAIYQYIILPNQTLASVNGEEIDRGDYWKVRKLELLNQIAQYQQFAQFGTGQQTVQYQQLADQARAQLRTVESDPVDPSTLNRMVEDKVVLQNMGELDVDVSDGDIDNYILEFFGPAGAASPTPTLAIDPTAEAWASATAGATAQATPSPAATPPGAQSEAATPTASGTPAADATPTTPSPTPTISPTDAEATATATFENYADQVLDQADMSQGDFRRLVVRPQLAREQVERALQEQVPTRAEQVHAAHILVATEEAANAILNETLNDLSFEEVARQQSADDTTAANGGDLGWFPRGIMPSEFDEVVFNLEVRGVSPPVQTRFGWHLIKLYEKEQDRPVSQETLTRLRQPLFSEWLEEQRERANVDWKIDRLVDTSTPEPEFAPPPDAPPTPTPTPSPTPAATPEPSGTPGADETEPTPTP